MADGAAASGLRDDRNVCQLCGALENLSLCGGCRDTWYCCKDHQRAHWKQHKQNCKGKQPKACSSSKAAGSASSSGPCREKSIEKQETASLPVTSHPDCQLDLSLSVPNVFSTLPDGATSSVTGLVADCSLSTPPPADLASNFAAPETLLQQTVPKSSKTSSKKSGGASGRKDFATPSQLPAIQEEGTSERYFLDARPFSQSLQSSPLNARARRTAMGMTPRNTQSETTTTPSNNNAYVTVMNSRFSAIAHYVVDCLHKYGICVIDQFLGDATGQEILTEVKQLQRCGTMRKGQLVNSTSPSSENIRGDILTWVDGRGQDSMTENIDYLVSCMDFVIQNCSSLMEEYRINERTKAMVACYPGAATGYVRHVDNPSGDGRCITCIYYLNRDWDCKVDGGMLRIYPEGKDSIANIAPSFDRLLFFWSDRRNPHEVLPSMRERYAITVWYYEAEERARALKRFKGEPKHPKKQAVPLFNGTGDGSL